MLKTLNWKDTPWQGPLAWLLAGGLALLLVSLAIQRLADRHLAADAERLAVGWGQQLGRAVPDFDRLFLGELPGPQAQERLGALRGTAGLLHFKLYDREGRLLLASESMGTAPREADTDPASRALAWQVAKDERPATQLLHGSDASQPAIYSRAWVPARLGQQVVGVVEVVVDQTQLAHTTATSFQRAAGVAVAAMLLCMAAAAALMRHRAGREKHVLDRVSYLAEHDVLTGALSHGPFNQRLQRACAQALPPGKAAAAGETPRGLAVICIDLDGFCEVNERHGHSIGDELLRRTGQRLQGVLRGADLLTRLAGDRFGILQLGAADSPSVTALVERIVDSLAQPHQLPGLADPVRVSACVGAALHGVDGEDADTLLHNAEMALLRAKASGRGAWSFYDASLDRTLQERRALAADLRVALQHGRLKLHFQPVYAGDGSTLKGYEALARWLHPTRGNVPPASFIPVAEDTGQIEALGRWVLQTACAEAATWPAPLAVAVNLSTAQFHRGQAIVNEVRQALLDSGLQAERLELEITESLLMQHTEQVLATLHALRGLGVRIAMDDFGTGYSSLAYLWRFPFDKLKIDRAFTQGLGGDPRVDVIVRSIVRLAHSLSIRVNAEGVETEHQRDALRRLGCDELQGYLLGRPAPCERLTHLESEVVGVVVPDVVLA
ncbi:MAG: bifunctional diguanylate cyclase/phosphodiesterase [Rubrivivax sp.]|nr:bifunctional diguanylate cyclase/phosphodiesterase [Rubrivivax sp.]